MAQPGWVVKRPRIVLLGDSLTELGFSVGGWAARLAEHYSRKADVINRGFSGYNSSWALHVLDEALAGCSGDNTAFVTLFFGANDAAMPLPQGHQLYAFQHVPLQQYTCNIQQIVQAVQARGIANILLITPPPVYEHGRNPASEAGWGRETAFAGQYAGACRQVAAEMGLPAVDLWSSMQAEQDWGQTLFSDGLHFTALGNQHVFQAVLAALDTAYPHFRSEAMPLQFPAWDTIDGGNPTASFAGSNNNNA